MKKKRLVMLLGTICLSLMLMLSLVGACAKPAPAPPKPEPIQWGLITAQPANHDHVIFLKKFFIPEVNKRAGGELIINYLGGPEVIPVKQQAEAVGMGVVDISLIPAAYYRGAMTETLAYTLSRAPSPAVERERGFYDFMDQLHQDKLNIKYLSRAIWGSINFFTFLNIPVETLDDFKGVGIRATPSTAPFAEKLGMSPVALPHAEAFPAIERGVVQGIMTTWSSFYGHGYAEVASYMVDHSYYRGNSIVQVNLDSWNQLPAHLQDLLMEVVLELEAKASDYFDGLVEPQVQEMTEKWGLTKIKLPPAEAEQYLDMAYDAQWEAMEIDSATKAKLREFLKP